METMTQSQIKLTPLEHEDFELANAACRLFTGAERGHLHKFLFSTSLWTGDPVRGAQLWVDFLRHEPGFTFAVAEAELLAEIARLITDNHETFDELIDFGPGSLDSFRTTTMHLINAAQPAVYRPIDACASFLSDITTECFRCIPSMRVQPEHKDFLLDFVDAAHGPACLYWSGGGFSNIGTNTTELPLAEIRSRLHRMRRFVPKGGRALITFDTCRNPVRLMAAYDHPAFAEFTMNVLYRIARDCPSIMFDPAAWKYDPVWNPGNHVVEHQIVATQAQVIYLPDQTVPVAKGDRFVINHSFKFPADMILRIAKTAGWTSTMMLGKGDLRMLALSA